MKMTWTDEARNELERFLVAERAWLANDPDSVDVDHEEVIADLRAHVHEDLLARGVDEVDMHLLREVLGVIRPGFGADEEPRPSPQPVIRSQMRPPFRAKRRAGFLAWVFGVILPLVTLIFELVTGLSKGEGGGDLSGIGGFIDPIPTHFYAVLIFLVPLMNWLMIRHFDKGVAGSRVFMTFVGMALFVNLLYGLLFLPMLPIALIGIMVYGLGLLPLSPVVSLLITISQLRKQKAMGASKGALAGFLFMLVLLLGIESRSLSTTIGANWAAETDSETSAEGIALIRNFGSEKVLLEACYGFGEQTLLGPGLRVFFLRESLARPKAEQARRTYYRLTGAAFNSVAAPSRVLDDLGWREARERDEERGGDEVAGRIRGLSLKESRIDTVVETGATLAYTEWELLFVNSTDEAQEARAQVQLPPGGFVSRLTLWINGEEREAAFDSTLKVKRAYRDVAVVKRRDPVLVSSSGPDRVLVQCFPVPADGEMRVRIGVTSPLLIGDYASGVEGSLTLPAIVEQNFEIPSSLEHMVWSQGVGEFLSVPDGLTNTAPAQGPIISRGSLTDERLRDPGSVLRLSLEKAPESSWVEEDFYSETGAVVQTLEDVYQEPFGNVLFVVDGGQDMGEAGEDLAHAIGLLPRDIHVELMIAGSSDVTPRTPSRAEPAHVQSMLSRLEDHDFQGGVEVATTLARAFDSVQSEAAERGGRPGAVVWLHGAQPVFLGDGSSLYQRVERAKDGTRIFAMRGAAGVNVLAADIGESRNFERIPRSDKLTNDLAQLLRRLTIGGPQPTLVRKHVEQTEVPLGAQKVSRNLARLWAGNESTRLAKLFVTTERQQAVDLALAHHLVTGLTGAVVLEEQAQYDRHGLTPVTVDAVPSVPEPETVALLIMVAGLLGFAVLRSRASA